MRYIWVLGHTKSGKSTRALALRERYPDAVVYEAGAWARKLYEEVTGTPVTSFNDSDPELRARMTELAMEALAENPRRSVEAFAEWHAKQSASVAILVGIRNPYDFFSILCMLPEAEHHCELLVGTAQDTFEKGVDVIAEYLVTGFIPEAYQRFASCMQNVLFPSYQILPGYQKDTK